MKKRVAINGFGRIGRLAFRELLDDKELELVAINDLGSTEDLYYLLKYDSNFRMFDASNLTYDEENFIYKGKKIRIYKEKDAINLPWNELNIDVVLECTGFYTNVEDAHKHIEAGAKHVIISAPAKGDCKTIVYNVNHDTLKGDEEVISAASCTTNCLAPVLSVIDKSYSIVGGYMTTVHATTNDQTTLDVLHKKGAMSRRGRAALENIIPTSTGAASAIGKVMPKLDGKLHGGAFRVPVIDGSMIDLSIIVKKKPTVEGLNEAFRLHVNETLDITMDPIVSSDVIGNKHGALVDGLLTDVIELDGNRYMVKVVAWYDNELGYTNQMIRTMKVLV
jgi:glyceraldehyde 3-phosphate dehydrogenase